MQTLGIDQGQQNRIVGGIALLCAVERIEPGVKLLTAFRQTQTGVIGDVVAAAHEGVNGAKRLALSSRQNEERVVEILRRRSRDAAAYRIRHRQLRGCRSPGNRGLLGSGAHGLGRPDLPRSFASAARATSASFRGREMEGLRPRTAKPWRSMALRISCPPRLKRSRSMASS